MGNRRRFQARRAYGRFVTYRGRDAKNFHGAVRPGYIIVCSREFVRRVRECPAFSWNGGAR